VNALLESQQQLGPARPVQPQTGASSTTFRLEHHEQWSRPPPRTRAPHQSAPYTGSFAKRRITCGVKHRRCRTRGARVAARTPLQIADSGAITFVGTYELAVGSFKQMPAPWDALETMVAGGKRDAGTGDKIDDGTRDEHFAGLR
jgi:hypothetical protein